MKGGKFDFLKTVREEAPSEEAPEIAPASLPPAASAPAPEGRKRGRPATGKRSDPDFEQVSLYLRRDTHRDVQIALLREGRKQDVSELVESLLAEWLRHE